MGVGGGITRWKKTEQLWFQLISHMSNSHSFNLTVPSFLLCKLGAWNRWPWRFSILNLILYNSDFSAHPVQQMIYSCRPISNTTSLKRFSMVQLLELYFPSSWRLHYCVCTPLQRTNALLTTLRFITSHLLSVTTGKLLNPSDPWVPQMSNVQLSNVDNNSLMELLKRIQWDNICKVIRAVLIM